MPGKYIIIHHSGGTDADPLADTSHHTFDGVNEYHKNKWNFRSSLGYYIGYHYFIEKDGTVKQGRSHDELGAHTIGYNDSIGVCLAGNFDFYTPTTEQVKSLKTLLKTLQSLHNIENKNIVPHRTFANKTCYGNRLSDNWASNLVTTKEINISFVISGIYLKKDIDFIKDQCVDVLSWIQEHENISFDITFSDTNESVIDQWDGDYISTSFLRDRIVPQSAGADMVVLLCQEVAWSNKGLLGYAIKEKILGSQVICMDYQGQGKDGRNRGRFDGLQFPTTLSHEISHSLYQMQSSRKKPNVDEYVTGGDNTHYFDYTVNNLEKVFDDIRPERFVTFKIANMERLFSYKGIYTKKRIKFSGKPKMGKVYRTDVPFLYFRYTVNGWNILSEGEYNNLVQSGERRGIMSLQEGFWIYDSLGETIPTYIGKKIKETLVSEKSIIRKRFLQLLGWSTLPPTDHLK